VWLSDRKKIDDTFSRFDRILCIAMHRAVKANRNKKKSIPHIRTGHCTIWFCHHTCLLLLLCCGIHVQLADPIFCFFLQILAKIKAIREINLQKLVNTCRYELPSNM